MLKFWPYFENPTNREWISLLYNSSNKKKKKGNCDFFFPLKIASVPISLTVWSQVTYKQWAQCCKVLGHLSSHSSRNSAELALQRSVSWKMRSERTEGSNFLDALWLCPFPGRFVCLITSAWSCSCKLKATRVAPATTAKKESRSTTWQMEGNKTGNFCREAFENCWNPGIFRSTVTRFL